MGYNSAVMRCGDLTSQRVSEADADLTSQHGG